MSSNNEPGPLWMPTGSIRSLLAVVIICSIPAFIAMRIPIPEMYWAMAGAVVGLYFYQSKKIAGTPTNPDGSELSELNEDIFLKLSLQGREIEEINKKLEKPQEISLRGVNHTEQ